MGPLTLKKNWIVNKLIKSLSHLSLNSSLLEILHITNLTNENASMTKYCCQLMTNQPKTCYKLLKFNGQ